MSEISKIAAILVSDVIGCSRLAGADEDRTLTRLRTLRGDPIGPTISVHRGRTVKRTGDGSVIEFRSVVAAVRCAGTVIVFAFYCMTAFALINEAFGFRSDRISKVGDVTYASYLIRALAQLTDKDPETGAARAIAQAALLEFT